MDADRRGGVAVADQELPAELHLRVGEEQRFALPNHGAGGYRWSVVVSGDCVAASIAYDEQARAPGLGERLGQVLTVLGVRTGKGSLALEERRSWQQGSPVDARTLGVVVQDSDTSQR